MQNAVGVSPFVVVHGVLIGSTLAGVAGALLAVPIAAVLNVIYLHFKPGKHPTQSRAESDGHEPKLDKRTPIRPATPSS